MASQMEESSPSLSAEVVGNAFVEQFYHILHETPELVHRFYNDASTVSRPGIDGLIKTVTTMQGINEFILSLGTNEFKAEILTADAQASYMDGVVLLVTGLLTGADGVSKKFIESFFLAPQDKGYYVLNDAFRFFENDVLPSVGPSEVKDSFPAVAQPEAADVVVVPSNEVPPVEAVTENNVDAVLVEAREVAITENGSSLKEEVVSQPPVIVPVVAEPASNVIVDAQKKTYASIVKVVKEGSASAPVRTGPTVRVASEQPRASTVSAGGQSSKAPSAGQQARGAGPAKGQLSSAPTPAVATSVVANGNGAKAEKAEDTDVDSGFSIYIGGLPYDTTPPHVEEVFKKFGPIKRGGIQVRTNQEFCFGFVEFESACSMEKAIEAKEIKFGDKVPFIQEKRTKSRANGGGRGYRNDGFRGRFPNGNGNFGRNGGYGRRGGEFSNGGGVRNGGGDSYSRGNQNGGGRGSGRQGVPKQ